MKFKKRIVAILVIASLFSLSITAMANSLTRTINGRTFTATTSITSTSGFAGTLSSTSQIYASVSATYNYVHPVTLDTGSDSCNLSGAMSVSRNFSAPTGYRSVSIFGNHSASSGGEYWSGSTSEIY